MGDVDIFSNGQVSNQYVRFELQELQKPERGRKCSKEPKDRRPLDPPPVALLRLYQMVDFGPGLQMEKEVSDYSDFEGLLCTVDLYKVSESVWERASSASTTSLASNHDWSGNSTNNPHISTTTLDNIPPTSMEITAFHGQNGFGIEPSQAPVTAELIGEKVAQPLLVDYQGRKVIMFAFGDLTVRQTGTFFLRYRVFDISSLTIPGMQAPIEAEVDGAPFKVYSTKEFPGLSASTDLTKVKVSYYYFFFELILLAALVIACGAHYSKASSKGPDWEAPLE